MYNKKFSFPTSAWKKRGTFRVKKLGFIQSTAFDNSIRSSRFITGVIYHSDASRWVSLGFRLKPRRFLPDLFT